MAKLFEGFSQKVVGGVRSFFSRAPEQRAVELRRGGIPMTSKAGLSYNLVSQFGYDTLAAHLYIDQDLQLRYGDYEEMDDYPEIGCLEGSCMVFTLEWGWRRIEELSAHGGSFHVISYDRKRKSLVPAKATKAMISAHEGHCKAMVRVTLDNGTQIVCTSDHPFMTKSGEWVEAEDLKPTMRLMPGVLRLGCLGGSSDDTYWQVHQPNSDSEVRSIDGKRWVWLHRLVAEEMLGVERGGGDIVHHENENPLDNSPGNLSIETNASHAGYHIVGLDNSEFLPEWTEERRAEQAKRMRGNTFSRGCQRSDEHKKAIGDAQRGRQKSEEHRRKIGLSQPNRINLSREEVEAALNEGGSVAEAARILGVSWSTAKRNAERHDLLVDGNNHRVLRVEVVDERPTVYDLHVPGFHNFICDGVVVHNTGLDIYADDSTSPELDREQAIWAVSKDRAIEADLNNMLHKRLGIEDDIWGVSRTLCKYGNVFGELLLADDGLVGINFLPPPTVRRVEDPRGNLLGYIQDVHGRFNISLEDFYQLATQRNQTHGQARPPGVLSVFEEWEVIHWRLRGKHLRSIYGHGVIEPARWIWKRLSLLEDAILIYKLERAPSRYAFYIDVGQMDMERGLAYVNRVKNSFTRKKFVNPNTGDLDMRYNPLAMDEDFFVPVRDGKRSTEIDVLQGPDYSEVETLEYHRDKLVSAIKIPKTYMGYGGEPTRTALSGEDIRFARTVMRIQRVLRSGFRQASRVHLIAKNKQPDRIDYDIRMNVPSQILELARMEVMSAKADLASRMKEDVGTQWVLEHIYNFSEAEAKELMRARDKDTLDRGKIDAKVEKMRMGESVDQKGNPIALSESERLERRISQLVTAVERGDWRRDFEGQIRSSNARLEAKLDRVLQQNPSVARRFQRLDGLLRDVRHSMRTGAYGAPPM